MASPFARNKPEGRFFKAFTPATIMAMGLVDWDTMMVTLKGFLTVQRWLGGVVGDLVLPVMGSGPSTTPEGGGSRFGLCRRRLLIPFRMECSCNVF